MADLSPRARERLHKQQTAWLCTLRPGGSPHLTPVWFIVLGGTWWIATAARNRKVHNVDHDPRVSIASADTEEPVVAEGRATVHRHQWPESVIPAFADKDRGWDPTSAEPDGPRVLIEIRTERWLLGASRTGAPSSG